MKSNYENTGNIFKDNEKTDGKRNRNKKRKKDNDDVDRDLRATEKETEYINQTQLRAVRMQQLESLNQEGFEVILYSNFIPIPSTVVAALMKIPLPTLLLLLPLPFTLPIYLPVYLRTYTITNIPVLDEVTLLSIITSSTSSLPDPPSTTYGYTIPYNTFFSMEISYIVGNS